MQKILFVILLFILGSYVNSKSREKPEWELALLRLETAASENPNVFYGWGIFSSKDSDGEVNLKVQSLFRAMGDLTSRILIRRGTFKVNSNMSTAYTEVKDDKISEVTKNNIYHSPMIHSFGKFNIQYSEVIRTAIDEKIGKGGDESENDFTQTTYYNQKTKINYIEGEKSLFYSFREKKEEIVSRIGLVKTENYWDQTELSKSGTGIDIWSKQDSEITYLVNELKQAGCEFEFYSDGDEYHTLVKYELIKE